MSLLTLARRVLPVAALALSGIASAAPIAPTFSTFGTLGGATFGGGGIPNTAVAITYADNDPQSAAFLTMGLTAHQRFGQPAVTNNGAGVFTALAGVSPDAPSPADPYARWNFGFYIAGGNVPDLVFALLYDLDPMAGTLESAHRIAFGAAGPVPSNPFQDSWNLGMNFLEAPDIFNPSATGEYTFALVAYEPAEAGALGEEVARVAIRVNVINGTPIPTPGTLALAGLALLGLAGVSRRRG